MKSTPLPLTTIEVLGLSRCDELRDIWGAESVEDMLGLFNESIYAAKFDFTSGGPGYCGELYMLLGDGLEPPVLVRRNKSGGFEVDRDASRVANLY